MNLVKGWCAPDKIVIRIKLLQSKYAPDMSVPNRTIICSLWNVSTLCRYVQETLCDTNKPL